MFSNKCKTKCNVNYFCVAYIFGIHFEINNFLVAPIRNSLGNNAATNQHFEEEILFHTADHLPTLLHIPTSSPTAIHRIIIHLKSAHEE